MITIKIAARLEVFDLPADLAQQFIRENSWENPKRANLERMGFWAGNEPRTIDLWTRKPGRVVLPRGYFPEVISALRQQGLPYTIQDATVSPPLAGTIEAQGTLYPFQVKALESLLRYSTGICEMPTGSGKTNVLLSAVARVNTPALILVHTTELLNQTRERVRSWLGVEPGIIGAGKERLAPVTVAMIQTLARRDLSGLAEYFGAVLVDECHHSPALTWSAILEQLPCRFKFGFTATAWRKDRLQFLMWRLIGPVAAKITKAEVEAAGRIVWPEMETVQTQYFYDLSGPDEWGAMITDLAQDEARNRLIESEVRRRLSADSQVLILTDRIEHANLLAGMMQDQQPILLTGKVSNGERKVRMQQIRDGARITIATVHLLGEGIDVPGWDVLFLVSPFAGGPRTLQAIGRISRPAPGKDKALCVDFIDAKVPFLVEAAKSRLRLWRQAA